MSFTFSTPSEICAIIGQRARARRLERGWSQSELAARAGIALPTLKVFEQGGQVSLQRLVLVVTALGHLADLETLLTAPAPASLDQLDRTQRQRGRSITVQHEATAPRAQRKRRA